MQRKSTSKLLKMIPREIRAIIMERPILTSESEEAYDNLLLCFAETCMPNNVPQWFGVKRACVLLWQEQRMHRMMPLVIETALVMEDARCKEAILIRQYKGLAADHPGKFDKKSLQQAIKDAKVPASIIEAKAFVERMSVLETMEKLLLSNDARRRFIHEELAVFQIIEALPKMANDNERKPGKLITQNKNEVDRDDEADRYRVEEPNGEESTNEVEANVKQAPAGEVWVNAEVEPDDADKRDKESDGAEEAAA